MRKNMLYIAGIITSMIISTTTVNALTSTPDGSFINHKGVEISANQYKVLSSKCKDSVIDLLNEQEVTGLSNPNVKLKKTKYIITTDIMDKSGKILLIQ